MRRGELLATRWGDLDLDAATVRIERSIEETASGLRPKGPKTRSGRRVITLPHTVIAVLREHRRGQLEQRFSLGAGALKPEDLVFATLEGNPLSPDNLSRDWRRTLRARKLPLVSFHALRHTHASALFAARVDIVTISRRLGHASPKVTLQVYAHVFEPNDAVAADAIDAAMQR
jgi:integrase